MDVHIEELGSGGLYTIFCGWIDEWVDTQIQSHSQHDRFDDEAPKIRHDFTPNGVTVRGAEP